MRGRLDGAAAVTDEQVARTVELEDRGGGERVGVAARVGQREAQGGHRVAPVHGQVVWSYYEVVAGREVPFPSLADLGYLLAVPLAAAALLTHAATPQRGAAQTRRVLDGLIIATAVLAVSWQTVLGPLFRAASGSVLEQVLALAYPVGDLVTISLVIFLLAGSRAATRAPLLLIGSGLVSIAFADSVFAYLTQTGAYGTGHLIDTGWFVGQSNDARDLTDPPGPEGHQRTRQRPGDATDDQTEPASASGRGPGADDSSS